MSNHDDFVALADQSIDLVMDLGNKWTSCIDGFVPTIRGGLPDLGRDAVSAVYQYRSTRGIFRFVYESRPLFAQGVHHVLVVDNLVTDIDGLLEELQGALHNFDRSVDTGTKASGMGQ
jgi:hypothetical protein